MLNLIFDPALLGKTTDTKGADKTAQDKAEKYDGLTPLEYWRKLQWTKKIMHADEIQAKEPLIEDVFEHTIPDVL